MKSLLAILAAASASFAITPYIGADLGYAFGVPSSRLGYDYTYTSSTTTSSYDGIYGSYGGSAILPGVHGGIVTKSGVGAELGLEYLFGLEQDIGSTTYKYTTYTDKTKSTATVSGVFLTPALVLSSQSVGPVSFYAKVGVVVGLGLEADLKSSDTYTSTTKNTDSSYTVKYSGGVAFGFLGATGVEFSVGKSAGIYAELNARSTTWAPSEYKTGTKTYTSETSYSYSSSSTNTKTLQTYLPMQSLILKVGANFYL